MIDYPRPTLKPKVQLYHHWNNHTQFDGSRNAATYWIHALVSFYFCISFIISWLKFTDFSVFQNTKPLQQRFWCFGQTFFFAFLDKRGLNGKLGLRISLILRKWWKNFGNKCKFLKRFNAIKLFKTVIQIFNLLSTENQIFLTNSIQI